MSVHAVERRTMGVWVFDLDDAETARGLYAALPAALRAGAELRIGLGVAHLTTESEAAAAWLRERALAG